MSSCYFTEMALDKMYLFQCVVVVFVLVFFAVAFLSALLFCVFFFPIVAVLKKKKALSCLLNTKTSRCANCDVSNNIFLGFFLWGGGETGRGACA